MPSLPFLARSLPCFTQKTHPFGCVFTSLLRFHFVVCGVVVLLPFKAVVMPFALRFVCCRRFFDDSDRNEDADDRGADLGEMRHIRAERAGDQRDQRDERHPKLIRFDLLFHGHLMRRRPFRFARRGAHFCGAGRYAGRPPF